MSETAALTLDKVYLLEPRLCFSTRPHYLSSNYITYRSHIDLTLSTVNFRHETSRLTITTSQPLTISQLPGKLLRRTS